MGDLQKVVILSLYRIAVARARVRKTRDRLIEQIPDAKTVVHIFVQRRIQFARHIRF